MHSLQAGEMTERLRDSTLQVVEHQIQPDDNAIRTSHAGPVSPQRAAWVGVYR